MAFLAVMIIVVASAAVMTVQLIATGGRQTTQPPITTTTSSGTPGRNVTMTSSQGLELIAATNATEIQVGGALRVDLKEFNTLAAINNVTASGHWPVQVSLGACGTYVQPFGIAVYSGHLDEQSIAQGQPLRIFPLVPCPLFIRLVTGYLFQPHSDLAVVLPSFGASPSPLTGSVNVSMIYTPSAQQLPPGAYTIVAADEWGAQAFLYFTVH